MGFCFLLNHFWYVQTNLHTIRLLCIYQAGLNLQHLFCVHSHWGKVWCSGRGRGFKLGWWLSLSHVYLLRWNISYKTNMQNHIQTEHRYSSDCICCRGFETYKDVKRFSTELSHCTDRTLHLWFPSTQNIDSNIVHHVQNGICREHGNPRVTR